jgi:DNA polymerase-3 subunit gamma/tau
MENQALYRRWRPQTFREVIGQEYTAKTLQNSIAQDVISHAYLFAGPRGIGKTSVARIFAKAINCSSPQQGEPCNQCDSCHHITQGRSLDVIEIDGASNRGIDQIRQLREEVNFVPAETKYKVYIIDEVHMLTNEAFNALLKTLEEPPPRVVFIFATTEPHKVPPTVLSRCQAFEFKNIPTEQIWHHLEKVSQAEEIKASKGALRAIARRAKGSVRDALVLLEQLASYKGREMIKEEDLLEVMGLPPQELVLSFLKAVIKKDHTAVLEIIDGLAERGKDPELFLESLIELCRDLIVDLIKGKSKIKVKEEDLTPQELIKLNGKFLELKREMRYSLEKRIMLEVGTLKILQEQVPLTVRVQERSREVQQEQEQEQKQEQDIAKLWKKLLEVTKKERVALCAFLSEGQPHLKGGVLRIEFDPHFKFHKENLEQKENKAFVEGVVKQFFGDVKLEIAYSAFSNKKKEKDALDQKAEMVREFFKGEIVS